MPKATTIKNRDTGMGAAFDADQEVVARTAVQRPRKEAKTATMTQKVEPSLRRHFLSEAAKRGEKLTPIIVKLLIERYGELKDR